MHEAGVTITPILEDVRASLLHFNKISFIAAVSEHIGSVHLEFLSVMRSYEASEDFC